MGNRRAREFKLQQEREESARRLREEPRRLGNRYENARVQLARCPSFTTGICWEICKERETYMLFRSVPTRATQADIVGFDPVIYSTDELKHFVESLFALELPIAPVLNGMSGCDGEMFHLALFGDLHSVAQFHWWSEPPPTWQPMVSITQRMFTAFEGAIKSNPNTDLK